MNRYEELREKHQKEYNAFPQSFAFDDNQLKEGLKELGLNENDTHKVIGIPGGGFIRATDEEKYIEMLKRHNREHQEQISLDKDGTGYIKDMFITELINHEYGYTNDLEDTLVALGLNYEDIIKSESLKNGLELAKKIFHKEDIEIEEELEMA